MEHVYENTLILNRGAYRSSKLDGSNPQTPTASATDPTSVFRKGVRRVKPKNLDHTPYELRKVTAIPVKGTWKTSMQSPYGILYEGLLNARILNSPLRIKQTGFEVDTNLDDVSRLKALSKLNHRDLDFGTAFAEAGKTASLVGDVAALTVRAMRAARRGNFRDFKHALESDTSHRLPLGQSAVDANLAYYYGVKPMLHDVAGMVEALTRLPPECWLIRTKGAYANERVKHSTAVGHAQAYVDAVSHLRESSRTVVSAVRRALTLAEDRRWSLGLDDPLSTAWELTPYSFVADWLFPVGTWLEAINASKYYTDWSVCTTHYIRESTTVTPSNGWRGFRNQDLFWGDFKGGVETLYVKRSLTSEFPFTTIPMLNPMSLKHMSQGLSLLASNLARHGEPPRWLRR